jgi:hypothetical protein
MIGDSTNLRGVASRWRTTSRRANASKIQLECSMKWERSTPMKWEHNKLTQTPVMFSGLLEIACFEPERECSMKWERYLYLGHKHEMK